MHISAMPPIVIAFQIKSANSDIAPAQTVVPATPQISLVRSQTALIIRANFAQPTISM